MQFMLRYVHPKARSGIERILPCVRCGERTLHLQRQSGEFLHGALTALTLGAWMLVWVLIDRFNWRPFRCCHCATPYHSQ
jgi:hypothetical protein